MLRDERDISILVRSGHFYFGTTRACRYSLPTLDTGLTWTIPFSCALVNKMRSAARITRMESLASPFLESSFEMFLVTRPAMKLSFVSRLISSSRLVPSSGRM